MKLLPKIVALLVGAAFCVGGAVADSRHHHHHGHAQFGFYFGFPWYYYPPPIYTVPRVIVVPAQPPVYIEQYPAPDAQQYWYFCQQANAYYPQVPDCPGGWLRVPAR